MMDYRPIFLVIGILLSALALGMIVPAIVDAFIGNPDWQVFAISSGVTLFVGGAMTLTSRAGGLRLSVKQAFVMTTFSWIALTLFASIPFVFSELELSFTDAFFEAMSGITTTGSTVITGLGTAWYSVVARTSAMAGRYRYYRHGHRRVSDAAGRRYAVIPHGIIRPFGKSPSPRGPDRQHNRADLFGSDLYLCWRLLAGGNVGF